MVKNPHWNPKKLILWKGFWTMFQVYFLFDLWCPKKGKVQSQSYNLLTQTILIYCDLNVLAQHCEALNPSCTLLWGIMFLWTNITKRIESFNVRSKNQTDILEKKVLKPTKDYLIQFMLWHKENTWCWRLHI